MIVVRLPIAVRALAQRSPAMSAVGSKSGRPLAVSTVAAALLPARPSRIGEHIARRPLCQHQSPSQDRLGDVAAVTRHVRQSLERLRHTCRSRPGDVDELPPASSRSLARSARSRPGAWPDGSRSVAAHACRSMFQRRLLVRRRLRPAARWQPTAEHNQRRAPTAARIVIAA